MQLLKAISFLHEGLRIAHWDIKPQNIFLATNFEVKLGDFGIAKQISQDLSIPFEKPTYATSTGFAGTLQYIAPEIIQKRKRGEFFSYDPFKSDMWSLGVTLHQLITNQHLFDAKEPKKLIDHIWNFEYQSFNNADSEIKKFWNGVLKKLINKDSQERPNAS